jgi:glycosyltransferase involved in cell wall biosynthesis
VSILISAIIPTHNRVDHLLKAIESVSDQSLDKKLYEIIVVDNASSDETKKMVLERSNARISNLRYLYESQIGLTAARNSGWQNASGKYIVYMDDDAIASFHWLEKIVWVFENVEPMPGVVGGKIEPIWETEKPKWLTTQLEPYLTILDWSDQPRYINEKEYLAGANIAFPKFLLEKANGFQSGLGRVGKKLISNEEISLINNIRETGYGIYYHPEISVKHWIPKSRMTIEWFKSRFFWQGYSDSLMWLLNVKPTSLHRIKSLSVLLGRFVFNYHNWMPFLNSNSSELHLKLDSYHKLGKIKGLMTNIVQN